jgi:hypothetical protein
MLVLITITHVPTRYSAWLTQPFGYVSAAEGFVFLSAFLVGAVYTRRAIERGTSAMRAALWRRAGLVWLCQAGMLLFLFTVITNIGLRTDRQAIKNLISFYLQEPIDALWTSLVLIYNPPLLDILPMYVLFMIASPLALSIGLRKDGWLLVILVSMTIWLLTQFGLTQFAYDTIVRATDLKVPLHEIGAFELAAWQFMWILGMWMGSQLEAVPRQRDFRGWVVAAALIYGIGCMVWRHTVGLQPFGANPDLNLLFDKWRLGPLRLLDFFALVIIVMRFGPALAARVRFTALETLGKASLPVFCAQVVAVLVVLSAIGDREGMIPLWADTLLLAGTLAALYAVALISSKLDRDERAPSGTVNARTAAR